jgi:hypothetical protein
LSVSSDMGSGNSQVSLAPFSPKTLSSARLPRICILRWSSRSSSFHNSSSSTNPSSITSSGNLSAIVDLQVSHHSLRCYSIRGRTHPCRSLIAGMTTINLSPIFPNFRGSPRPSLDTGQEATKAPYHGLTSSGHGRDIPLHLVRVDRCAILVFSEPGLVD